MPQGRDMDAEAGEGILAQDSVTVMVERRPGRFTDDAELDIFHQRSQNHNRSAERLSSGQDVELLPRWIVLAFDELVDHRCNIATVTPGVVAQIDDQATGFDLIDLS